MCCWRSKACSTYCEAASAGSLVPVPSQAGKSPRCGALQARLGRDLGPTAQRWGPRPIDLDIVFYEGQVRPCCRLLCCAGIALLGAGMLAALEPLSTSPSSLLAHSIGLHLLSRLNFAEPSCRR